MESRMASLLLSLETAVDQDPVLDWEAVFGNRHPVELEIGIGKGRFLIDAAQRLPDVNFVGIEWALKYLAIAHRRSLNRQLRNIRLVQGDAREFVEFFVPSGSLQAIHLYFPDPWPKKRHHKRRLFDAAFLGDVERTLQPGGRLWLATDFAEYFEVMLEVLALSRRLEPVAVPWPGVRTNYEDKYLAQEKPIFRRVLEKQRIEA
jgi:tRNA (guanine-N7-)-methyltransferase